MKIFGIVNITRDSFSDGGRYLPAQAAIDHGLALWQAGADVLDLGAASSHPDAEQVTPDEEIRRLAPVIAALHEAGCALSVDTYHPSVQAFAMAQGVAWLNDIEGFAHPGSYGTLAASDCGLVVMHSVQRRGPATRVHHDAEDVWAGLVVFLAARVAALVEAGVERGRLVVDPGMGFFLGDTPEPSVLVLQRLPALRARLGLPVLVSVSRKSFLRALTERTVDQMGAATLAAELHCVDAGVDYVRTHDVAALADAVHVRGRLVAG